MDNVFEFGIPTHIKFTLYKFDYIDSIIITRVLKECKNWNTADGDAYTIQVDSFKSALFGSPRLKSEIQRTQTHGLSSPGFKPNSVSFLWSILERLPNLTWLTFNISYDKTFTRLIKVNKRDILSFYFKIDEGVFDLTKVFDRESLDTINRMIIEFGIMPNKYLERSPYFYMKNSMLFEILDQIEINDTLNAFDIFNQLDPKLNEDDPILMVITDYTPY